MTARDVFISHSSRDGDVAKAVCEKLESEKISCWIAPRDVLAGTEWIASLVEGITQSRVFVLVFSSNANGSKHVAREVYLAASKSKPIVQFRIEDVELVDTMRFFLGTEHRLDASSGELREDMERLVETLRQHLAQEQADEQHDKLPPQPAVAEDSIAVLPFRNLTPDDAFAHVADGIATELRSTFAKVHGVRVAPRASSAKYAAGEDDVRELGEKLRVRFLLSGSVHCTATKFRVTVELDSAVTEEQVWARSFDYDMDDLFDAQTEIATAVVNEFSGVKLTKEIQLAAQRPTDNLDAWSLVQRARAFIFGITPKALNEADKLLRRAIGLDEMYAAAHAALASVLGERLLLGISADIEADRNEAMDLADRALLQSPGDPFVLKMCGSIWAYVGDSGRSVDLLRHATRLSPYDLGAWGYLGWPLVETGNGSDLDEAHRIMERILSAAPDHPGACFWHYHRSVAFACQGEHERAAESVRAALALNHAFPWGWMHKANVLGLVGTADEAKQALDTCLQISPTLTPSHYELMVRGMSANDDVAAARVAGLRNAGLLT